MKAIVAAVMVLGSVLAAGAVQAQEPQAPPEEMRSYFSALYAYTFENDDRDADAGHGAQLSFGKALNRWWGVELAGFYSQFDQDQPGGPEFTEYGAKLDGLFFYSRKRSFSPYFGLGIGGMRNDEETSDESSTDPFVDAGLGFISYLGGGGIGLRGDLRYRHIFLDDDAFGGTDVDDFGEPIIKVGLVIPFGSGKKPEPAKQAAAACADSDGDGVCDTADLCPGTEAGTVVDAKGCPKESDGGANRRYEDVRFAFDRSDLSDYAMSSLDKTADTINSLVPKYPSLKVELSGHTDWIGTEGYNQALSERRANSVKSYLLRRGVEADRINTQAFGETKPVADNKTAEGRAQNRRVEIQTRE